MIKHNRQKGFGTLYIVIILGMVVLSLSLWLSTGSFWSIQNGVNLKASQQIKSLTEACAEVALEVVRENNSYTGTDSVTIGTNSCTYTVSNTGGNNRQINISGTVGSVTRKLRVTTSFFNPITISNWQENI